MSQDRNPYYDSVRGKADRSEFASLRMEINPPRRSRSAGRSWLGVAAWLIALVILAAIAKRYFFGH